MFRTFSEKKLEVWSPFLRSVCLYRNVKMIFLGFWSLLLVVDLKQSSQGPVWGRKVLEPVSLHHWLFRAFFLHQSASSNSPARYRLGPKLMNVSVPSVMAPSWVDLASLLSASAGDHRWLTLCLHLRGSSYGLGEKHYNTSGQVRACKALDAFFGLWTWGRSPGACGPADHNGGDCQVSLCHWPASASVTGQGSGKDSLYSGSGRPPGRGPQRSDGDGLLYSSTVFRARSRQAK